MKIKSNREGDGFVGGSWISTDDHQLFEIKYPSPGLIKMFTISFNPLIGYIFAVNIFLKKKKEKCNFIRHKRIDDFLLIHVLHCMCYIMKKNF